MSLTVYGKDFLTGSRFYGTPDDIGMQGFGVYIYPNGTRYIGYFENGLFNGEGTFELADPNISFRAICKDGQLVNISKVYFNDNLRVDFTLDDENAHISFDNWDYCTPNDRRFYDEMHSQILPVGPTSYKTAKGPIPEKLDRDVFDTGFGYFNRKNFLYGLGRDAFYVGSCKDRKWIRTHCRHGELYQQHIGCDIMADFIREIIANNIEEQNIRICLTELLKRNENHLQQIYRSHSSFSSQYSRKRTRLYNMCSTDATPINKTSEDKSIPMDPLEDDCMNILLKKDPYLKELKFDGSTSGDPSSDPSAANYVGCAIQ